MDLVELHGRAVESTAKIARGVEAERWSGPSPCTEWTVRDVLNHLTYENLWVPELVVGKTVEEVGDRYDGDVLGDDPVNAFETSGRKATQAFSQPGALTRDVAVSYGPVPGEVYAGHHFMDLVVHGWDIAKGSGQDTALDPELVDAAIAIIEPQLEFVQASGVFDVIEIPEDADPQTRLLAMLGRRG